MNTKQRCIKKEGTNYLTTIVGMPHVVVIYVVVMNALIDMYAACGNAEKANSMQYINAISWNALISG